MIQTVLLGNIGRVVTGKTPPKANPEYWGDQLDFITPTDFKDSKYIEPIRKLSDTGMQAMGRIICPADSVIVTCIGSDMGKVALAARDFVSNQQINTLIVDPKKADSDFIYYLLKMNRPLLRKYAESNGSTMPIINKSTFAKLPFAIPDLKTQKKIADNLGTIDEKIELNRKMNETLERIGKALFRYYFIDNPEAKKREKHPLTDYVELVNGTSYKSADLRPSRNALVTLKSVSRGGGFSRRGYKEYTGGMKESQIVHDGDLIVAHTDLTQKAEVAGYPALVDGADQYKQVAISMDIVKVIPRNDELSSSVVYFLLKTHEFQSHKMGYISGSTVLHLNKKCIPDYMIALPDNVDKVRGISSEFNYLTEQIKVNNQQISTLTTLRDTLLPRLVNGKTGVL